MTDRKKVLELFEAQKDFMNTTVQNNIEANRKGYATINLTDSKGNAIPDAKISVNQKTHELLTLRSRTTANWHSSTPLVLMCRT